jgi:hypothetical protein
MALPSLRLVKDNTTKGGSAVWGDPVVVVGSFFLIILSVESLWIDSSVFISVISLNYSVI